LRRAESFDQRLYGGNRLLRRVQLVAGVGKFDYVRYRLGGGLDVTFCQQISLLMAVLLLIGWKLLDARQRAAPLSYGGSRAIGSSAAGGIRRGAASLKKTVAAPSQKKESQNLLSGKFTPNPVRKTVAQD